MFNSFYPSVLFLYPLKTSQNQTFCDVSWCIEMEHWPKMNQCISLTAVGKSVLDFAYTLFVGSNLFMMGSFQDPDCTVFVSNVDNQVTPEHLWELFLQVFFF